MNERITRRGFGAAALSGTVVLQGGVMLKGVAFISADPTSMYGTAKLSTPANAVIDKGLSNPMTITFNLANPIKTSRWM